MLCALCVCVCSFSQVLITTIFIFVIRSTLQNNEIHTFILGYRMKGNFLHKYRSEFWPDIMLLATES